MSLPYENNPGPGNESTRDRYIAFAVVALGFPFLFKIDPTLRNALSAVGIAALIIYVVQRETKNTEFRAAFVKSARSLVKRVKLGQIAKQFGKAAAVVVTSAAVAEGVRHLGLGGNAPIDLVLSATTFLGIVSLEVFAVKSGLFRRSLNLFRGRGAQPPDDPS